MRARFVAVDRDGDLVVRRPRAALLDVFLLTLGLFTFVAAFPIVLLRGMSGADEWTLPVIGGAAAGALALTLGKRWRDRSPRGSLHVDRRMGRFAFPADTRGHRIDAIDALTLESRETNVSINDVPQVEHRIHALLDGMEVDVFAFRGAPEEGEDVRAMLAREFGVRGGG